MTIGILCVTLLLALIPASEANTPGEYQVKAAFLYYFAEFVEWPSIQSANENERFTIGILGEDPFGNDIDNLIRGKVVRGKQLEIKRFDKLKNVSSCQILFISSSEKDRLVEIFDSLKSLSILTVGELDGFVHSGGMINLVIDSNRVQFEVNLKAATRSGLKISSKLLRVARWVND